MSSPQIPSEDNPKIISLRQALSPEIDLVTPSSDPSQYKVLNTHFQASHATYPLAIASPKSASQVSQLVRAATNTKLSVSIVAGGHDLFRRSSSGDVVLSLKRLNSITISEDKQSVRVGGGTIFQDVLDFLDPYGLNIAVGGCPSVGVVGWATGGGYSLVGGEFGMGCDQILGATLVSANGDIFEADEDLLWGLRGGGCNFGVVVELKIKVYALPKILAGLVVFPQAAAENVLLQQQPLYEKDLPDALGADLGLVNFPGVGRVLVFFFTWSSADFETGRKILDSFLSMGPVLMNTVGETTLSAFMKSMAPFSLWDAQVNLRSQNVPNLSQPVISLLLKHVALAPIDSTTNIIIHRIHGAKCIPQTNTAFAQRSPHLLIEIIATSPDPAQLEGIHAWADTTHQDIQDSGLAMPMYPTFGVPGSEHEAWFGDNYEKLKALKKRIDGGNSWAFAAVSLV